MKKALVLVLLLSDLLLYGCGSHGASNGNNPVSTTGGGSQPSSGGFTLQLVDAVSSGVNSLTGVTVAGTPQVATDVRVVIRQFAPVTTTYYICDYDDNGVPIDGTCRNVDVTTSTLVYKDIQDMPYPTTGSSVQVGIPAGTYTLDVIVSKLESGNHSIVKYGQLVDVIVAPNASASIIMKTVNDIFHMTVADSVVSKGTFNVTLNDALPFAPGYKMTMSYDDKVNPVSSSVVSSSTNTCSFTAPTSFLAGTISLQGQFIINSSFLNRNDLQAQWTRLFPNAAYGEQVYSNLNPLIAVTVTVN